MALVVKCDFCGKEFKDDDVRVVLVPTVYEPYNPTPEEKAEEEDRVREAVTGRVAARTTRGEQATGLMGSQQQYIPEAQPQVDMHEQCWESVKSQGTT